MKAIFIFLTLSAILFSSGLGCSDVVNVENWRHDLRILEQQLEERHVDLYHTVPKDTFAAAVDSLYERIPNLTRPEILVGFSQLLAMIGDGHTSFYPSDQKKWRFHYYPIRLYSFSDGVYLTATAEEYAHLFGKRLVQIDKTSISDAFRTISTTICADNDMEYQYTAPFELTRPEMLHVLGIADSLDRAVFVFEDGTQQEFSAMTVDHWLDLDWLVANSVFGPERRSPSMRHEFLFASSLTLPHLKERKYYWYAYIEEHQTLFFQYNACWDQKDRPSLKEVVEKMFAFLDENPVERLVVDLRQNTGGEPLIAGPLIAGLKQRPELSARGGLFVLTGRRTFSAAVTNAAHLRSKTGARIVGEPPRGKPNSPSEGRDIDLDRTDTWATVSTQFVERDSTLGDAEYLPVDIPATYSFDAYQEGMDPVLDAALNAALYDGSNQNN